MSGGFGQIVLGPPGSGKTTYCTGMKQFLEAMERKVMVVNLDPANDYVPYDCCANISELITLEDVMENLNLGPNGGMVYCLEFLEKNISWLINRLEDAYAEASKEKEEQDENSNKNAPYFLFDLPGQVELFTHHESLRNIVDKIQKDLDIRLSAVHLVDSYHCSDPSKFISVLFLSLSTMLRLELPHVNVLSKVDMMESRGALQFNLDFYTEALDLEYLLPLLPSGISLRAHEGPTESVEETAKRSVGSGKKEEEGTESQTSKEVSDNPTLNLFQEKYTNLNRVLCNLVEEYSLVAFHTLNIEDKESVYRLIKAIDKTNGYVQSKDVSIEEWLSETNADIQEKYMKEMFSS